MYKYIGVILAACSLAACTQEVDNLKSRNNFVVDIEASAPLIVLDEDTMDEIALDIKWTPAAEYGEEYLVTYTYEISVPGSAANAEVEYEDMGNFERSYTHAELHDMLVGHFGALTSSYTEMVFKITASFDGPTIILPDEASVRVRVKTYGAKQFAADKVYIGGSAVAEQMQLAASDNNPNIYVWTGDLAAGQLLFPVLYGDENNAIVPASGADTAIAETPMDATIVDGEDASFGWTIADADEYRVTVNITNRTVAVIKTSTIIEIDKMFLGGAAAPESNMEVTRTLENPNVYAFRGELRAGALYLELMFNEKRDMVFVPAEGDDIHDGTAAGYAQISSEVALISGRAWNIPDDGTYRIVVDTDARSVTFRSAATDLANKSVEFNKTYNSDGTPEQNPYTQEVTELWMYGTFNNYGTDSGRFTGFQEKYKLTQSLANPYLFVYSGAILPRQTANDDNNKDGTQVLSQKATVNFKVNSWNYNVYCYGSTADAERNKHSGYVDAVNGTPLDLVEGQGHNRYAFFRIPEGCNYVEVNIETLKVTFDAR